jgi:uncharacterized protein CbrC (UPF0167 family)
MSNQNLATAELRQAYAFDCDHCGTENFVRAIIVEMTDGVRERMQDDLGVDGVTGDWVTIPSTVKCSCCGSKFRAIEIGQESEDEVED